MAWTPVVLLLVSFVLYIQTDYAFGAVCSYDLYTETRRDKTLCAAYAKSGQCDSRPDWMRKCAKSCNKPCGDLCPEMEFCKHEKVDLSIIMDSSVSISDEAFFKEKDFVIGLLNCFDVSEGNTHVSVITYGDRVYTDTDIGFDGYGHNVDTLIDKIINFRHKKGSSTTTGKGIKYMVENQSPKARQGVPHIAVVLTDGGSQNKQETGDEAKRARDAGITIFAVGVGASSYRDLNRISGSPQHSFRASNSYYPLLGQFKAKLKPVACPGGGISPGQPGPNVPPKNGVIVDPEGNVQGCRTDAELMLLIDCSTSIGLNNFKIGMNFIGDFVETFEGNIRVAAVTYSTDVWTKDVIEFSTAEDVGERIKNLTWWHGSTFTGKGLKYVLDNFVNKARDGFNKVLILITDGEPHDPRVLKAEAKRAHELGVRIIILAAEPERTNPNSPLDLDFLHEIAAPDGEVIEAKKYSELDNIKTKLTKSTCAA